MLKSYCYRLCVVISANELVWSRNMILLHHLQVRIYYVAGEKQVSLACISINFILSFINPSCSVSKAEGTDKHIQLCDYVCHFVYAMK